MLILDFDNFPLYIERGFEHSSTTSRKIIDRTFTDNSFEQIDLGSRRWVDTKINIVRLDDVRYRALIAYLNGKAGDTIGLQLDINYEDIFGVYTQPNSVAYVTEISPTGEQDFSHTDSLHSITLGLRLIAPMPSTYDWLFVIETQSRGADIFVTDLPASASLYTRAFRTGDRTIHEWNGVAWNYIAQVKSIYSVLQNDSASGFWDGNYYLALWADYTMDSSSVGDFSFYRPITFRSGWINEESFNVDQWSIPFEQGLGQLEDTAGFSFSIDNRIGFYKNAVNAGLAFHGSKVQLFRVDKNASDPIKLIRTGVNNQNRYSLDRFTFEVRSTFLFSDAKYPPQNITADDFLGVDDDVIGQTALRTFGYHEVGKIQPLITEAGSFDFYDGLKTAGAFFVACQTAITASPSLSIQEVELIDSLKIGLVDIFLIDSIGIIFDVLAMYSLGGGSYRIVLDSSTLPSGSCVLNRTRTPVNAFTPAFSFTDGVASQNPPAIVINIDYADWETSEASQKIDQGFPVFLRSGIFQSKVLSYYPTISPDDLRSRPVLVLESRLPIVPTDRLTIGGVSQAYQINAKDCGLGLRKIIYQKDSTAYLSDSYENVSPQNRQFVLTQITKIAGDSGAIVSSPDTAQIASNDLYLNMPVWPLVAITGNVAGGTATSTTKYGRFSYADKVSGNMPIYATNVDPTGKLFAEYPSDFSVSPVQTGTIFKTKTPFSVFAGANTNIAYGAYLRSLQNGVYKGKSIIFIRNIINSSAPVVTAISFIAGARVMYSIDSNTFKNFGGKNGLRMTIRPQITFAPNTNSTIGPYPSPTRPVKCYLFFVKNSIFGLNTNLQDAPLIDETQMIASGDDVTFSIPKEYLDNDAELLRSYDKIHVYFELPSVQRVDSQGIQFLGAPSNFYQSVGTIEYNIGVNALFVPVGKVTAQEEEVLLPAWAEIDGQEDDNVVGVMQDILDDSPVTKTPFILGFPNQNEDAGRENETIHWQIDSKQTSLELIKFLAGQFGANITSTRDGSLQLRSCFEEEHELPKHAFDDTNILIGSLQEVRTRRIQEIYQNFRFRFDYRPNLVNNDGYLWQVDITTDDNGDVIINAPPAIRFTLEGMISDIVPKLAVSKAFYDNPQIKLVDLPVYYWDKNEVDLGRISSLSSFCRNVRRYLNYYALNAWEISFRSPAEPFISDDPLQVNDLVSFNSYSITASEDILCFVKSFKLIPDTLECEVTLYSLNPPDANGNVLDYVWDGQTGAIDAINYKFVDGSYRFKDPNQAGTYPSGDVNAIDKLDFSFDDNTYPDADDSNLPTRV